jgi:arylsulfatase/uncharacterized sulfatase
MAALLGLSVLASPASAQTPAPNAKRPNIVLVLVDDAGFTDFGAYGSEIATPNIDRLAARGVRFSNFHATPMCAPSRAMLLTGVDSHTAGVANLPETTPPEHRDLPAHQGRLAKNVVTVASRLKAAGYHTYMAGKWHLGHGPGDLPSDHGFDRSFALDATGGDNWEQRSYFPIYKTAEWFEDGEPVALPPDFYSSRFLVDRMIRHIDGKPKDGSPFLAYLPFLAIHIPIQAPAEFVARYEDRYLGGWGVQRQRRYEGGVRAGVIPAGAPMGPPPASVAEWNSLSEEEQRLAARSMAVNAGMLEAMDYHFGRLVDHLKRIGEYDNTLFVILSDNGPEAGDPTQEPLFRLWMRSVGYSQDPARLGAKGTYAAIGPGWASAAAAPGALYKFYGSEGGTRVPLVVAGPGVREGALVQPFSIISDIAPTLMEFAGARPAPPPAAPIAGRSLAPLLTGASAAHYPAEVPIGMEAAGEAMLFKGDYKLTRSTGALGDPAWRLYDIVRDPGETRDLSAAMPERAAQMLADYRAWAARVGVAEPPEGYTADREIAKNIGLRILEAFAVPLAAGAAVLAIAVVAFALWRRRLRQERPAAAHALSRALARGVLGLAGVFFLLVFLRSWSAPAALAATFGLDPLGAVGLATVRADVGGFFGAGALITLAAAVRGRGDWLWPVLLLLGLAIVGRAIGLMVDGVLPMLIPPMVVEALLILMVAGARRALLRPAPESAPSSAS